MIKISKKVNFNKFFKNNLFLKKLSYFCILPFKDQYLQYLIWKDALRYLFFIINVVCFVNVINNITILILILLKNLKLKTDNNITDV